MLSSFALPAILMITSCTASPIAVKRLGTADFSMVETTPVVWKGKLLRFESVRGGYGAEPNCPTCGLGERDPAMGKSSYYRFREVASPLSVTPSFAPGYSFGCAFVQPGSVRSDGQGDTMWAFGRGPNTTQIGAWWSTDLKTWHQGPGLQLTGFGHTANDYTVFNNDVHFGRGSKESYIMAIELGKPADVTGTPFTSVFASHDGSDDLSNGWVFLNPHTHVWPPLNPQHGFLRVLDCTGYAGACPTIRYVKADDYYYVLNLHSEPGGYATKVVRSKNLSSWEQAGEAVLDFKGMVAADKGKAPRSGSAFYYTNFTATMEDYIANATDINNSDIDFVDVNSTVYIAYSWGNQRGTEFLGAAVVHGVTSDKWLMSYF